MASTGLAGAVQQVCYVVAKIEHGIPRYEDTSVDVVALPRVVENGLGIEQSRPAYLVGGIEQDDERIVEVEGSEGRQLTLPAFAVRITNDPRLDLQPPPSRRDQVGRT